jgi:dTDP-4-amino-4,6-dideoxygalactose transaminase
MRIKIFDPVIGKEEAHAVKRVLQSHQWAIGSGDGLVSKFESRFRDYIGSKYCVAVDSGTAALHLALSVIDVRNKEVIIPSLCFVSVAHVVEYNGGVPVFADIDPKTLCITPEEISKKMTKKTKAVIPVHFGGLPCKIDKIGEIARSNKVDVIEDAALAAGSDYQGKKIGSHSDFVCFSFHPVKNIAMPKGGAVALNGKNADKAEKELKSLRWYGISEKSLFGYTVRTCGLNYYMNEFSAAIGLEQIRKLDKMVKRRRAIAKRYVRELDIVDKMPFDSNCSYNFFWLLTKNRTRLIREFSAAEIECGTYHTPIHRLQKYGIKSKLIHTDRIAAQLVCIPCHPLLKEDDVDKIISIVNRYS